MNTGPELLFIGFTPSDGLLMEFGLCVPHHFNPVEQEVMGGQFHVPNLPGVPTHLNMNGNILQRYLIRISRGANSCGQYSLKKNFYFTMKSPPPHFQLFYFNFVNYE